MPSFATVMRIFEACGMAGDVELSPRVRSHNGLDRGVLIEYLGIDDERIIRLRAISKT